MIEAMAIAVRAGDVLVLSLELMSSAFGDQQLSHRFTANIGGIVERRNALFILGINVCPLGNQTFGRIALTI